MVDKHAIERLEVAMATLQAELNDIAASFEEDQLCEANRLQLARIRMIDVAAHFEMVRAIYGEDWPAEVIELWRVLEKP